MLQGEIYKPNWIFAKLEVQVLFEELHAQRFFFTPIYAGIDLVPCSWITGRWNYTKTTHYYFCTLSYQHLRSRWDGVQFKTWIFFWPTIFEYYNLKNWFCNLFLFVGNSIKYSRIYFSLNWFWVYFSSIEYFHVFYLRWQAFVIQNSYNKNSSFLSLLYSIMQSENFFTKNLPEDILDIF